MIKLGTVKDLYKVQHLDKAMQNRIAECLNTLDDNYGADRDIDCSLGGFVAIIEDEADIEQLRENYLDVNNDTAEYTDDYNGFTESLYLLNDDYSVVVFVEK